MRQRFFDFCISLRRRDKQAIFLALDTTLAGISLFIASSLILERLPSGKEFVELAPVAGIIMVIVMLLTVHLGLHKIKLNAYQLPSLVNSASVATIIGGVGFIVSSLMSVNLPIGVFVVLSMTFLILTVSCRVILRNLVTWIYTQRSLRTRVLIYGAGQTGQQLAAALLTDFEILPIAFVDDNPQIQTTRVGGMMVHAPSQIAELVSRHRIDRVILAMPSAGIPAQTRISTHLRSLGCDVHVLPSFADLVQGDDKNVRTVPVEFSDFLGRRGLDDELPGVSEAYIGRNILITGAGGSIGSELCRQLLSCKPGRLVLLDHSEAALYSVDRDIRDIAGSVPIIPVLGSICEPALVAQVIAENKIDVILHAAAYKHVPLVEGNAIEGVRNNVIGTKILADAARAAHVERFTLISTDKAVRPVGIMGCTKRLAEMIVQDLSTRSVQTRFSMVRFGNVLGSSGSVIPLFQDQIARGGPITLTHEDVTRYFMTLSEAVRLVLLAGSFTRGGDVFVLDMGTPVPIKKVAQQMIEGAGYSIKNAANPKGDIEIVVTGLRPGEKLHEELLLGSDMLTTPHSKILRAQEGHLSEIEMANVLQSIRRAVENRDTDSVLNLLNKWVETADKLQKSVQHGG